MSQWVQWDDETNRMIGMLRHLPANLEGRDRGTLALMGYRENVRQLPEDYIARWPALLGSATFTLLEDGRVLETFPDADYSVEAVRRQLVVDLKQAASRELAQTDWYVMRKLELGTAIPKEVVTLRKRIRDHVAWVEKDILKKSPRELVEYRWMFPKTAEQQMVGGLPVKIAAAPPSALTAMPVPPETVNPETGEALNVFGNTDPNVVDPPPAVDDEPERTAPPSTTDGEVLIFTDDEPRHYLDANGMPLVTVYAPNVENTGPDPDNN